jgi:hypothetical protein
LYCSSHFEVSWLWTSKSSKDKARPKTYCKYYGSVVCPLLKFLHTIWQSHTTAQNAWPPKPLIFRNINMKVSQQMLH